MTIYLTPALASNRKGRFLSAQLGAKVVDENGFPENGLLLSLGDELTANAEARFNWAMQPSCGWLVLPPYGIEGNLFSDLPVSMDWQIQECINKAEEGIAFLLGDELNQGWKGHSGGSEPVQHQSHDMVHTRFYRQKSNSGIFAATTLPLWSISLLDGEAEIEIWLGWFLTHCGEAAETEKSLEIRAYQLEKLDFSLLLLVFVSPNLDALELEQQAEKMGLFNLSILDIPSRLPVLIENGYIREGCLTKLGEEAFRTSAYWAYAEVLAQQLQLGASR